MAPLCCMMTVSNCGSSSSRRSSSSSSPPSPEVMWPSQDGMVNLWHYQVSEDIVNYHAIGKHHGIKDGQRGLKSHPPHAPTVVVSYPDSTLCKGKSLGTLERFLGHAHQHYIISTAQDGACYFRSWAPKESKIWLVIKLHHRRHILVWHKTT